MDPSPQNLRLLLEGEVKIGRALKAGALFVWRILRALFAKGISAIIRLGNKLRFGPERQRPNQNLTGVMGFARLPGFPSFPWQRIALYLAAILFALAWAEWRYRDGRRDGGHEVRNQYAESDRRAAQHREESRKEVAAIGTEHAVNRERIAANAQRGRDEITRAAPQVEKLLDADLERAYRSALGRLCLYPDSNGQLPAGCGSGA
jgi:hypothetical protein